MLATTLPSLASRGMAGKVRGRLDFDRARACLAPGAAASPRAAWVSILERLVVQARIVLHDALAGRFPFPLRHLARTVPGCHASSHRSDDAKDVATVVLRPRMQQKRGVCGLRRAKAQAQQR